MEPKIAMCTKMFCEVQIAPTSEPKILLVRTYIRSFSFVVSFFHLERRKKREGRGKYNGTKKGKPTEI